MLTTEDAKKLNNALEALSGVAAWAGEGNALSIPAIYMACMEAVTSKLAAKGAA